MAERNAVPGHVSKTLNIASLKKIQGKQPLMSLCIQSKYALLTYFIVLTLF
jgi:hypothetical protein